MDTSKVNRVEVIDHYNVGGGRAYVNWRQNNKVEAQLQDQGKTLKIFISKQEDNVLRNSREPLSGSSS